jgi:hypothetical protein
VTDQELKIDFSGVKDNDIVDGWHSANIFEVTPAVSKNGNRQLKVQYKIVGGPSDGRSVFDNKMLETDALWSTKQWLRRLGQMKKEDTSWKGKVSDLIGLECEIRIVNEDYEGDKQPRVKGIRAVGGGTLESV